MMPIYRDYLDEKKPGPRHQAALAARTLATTGNSTAPLTPSVSLTVPKKKGKKKGKKKVTEEDKSAIYSRFVELDAVNNLGCTLDRSPGFWRRKDIAEEGEICRLGLGQFGWGGRIRPDKWHDVVDHLKTQEEREHMPDRQFRLWQGVVDADTIHIQTASLSERDGYTKSMVAVCDKHTVTVGRCIPQEGDTEELYTGFLCEFDEAKSARMSIKGEDDTEGMLSCVSIKDCTAIIFNHLFGVVRKMLMTRDLIHAQLAQDLELYADALEGIDSVHSILIKLEHNPEHYRYLMDWVSRRFTVVLKTALQEKRKPAAERATGEEFEKLLHSTKDTNHHRWLSETERALIASGHLSDSRHN